MLRSARTLTRTAPVQVCQDDCQPDQHRHAVPLRLVQAHLLHLGAEKGEDVVADEDRVEAVCVCLCGCWGADVARLGGRAGGRRQETDMHARIHAHTTDLLSVTPESQDR
jgi:hypothetical protein